MAKRVTKVATPVVTQAQKPRQEATRWARIQDTRRKNGRTGEPVPGAMGIAYLWNPQSNLLEKVAVLSMNKNGTILIQRNIGGQFRSVPLSFLRTAEEVWNSLRATMPEILPKHRIDPQTKRFWDPAKLAPKIVAKVISDTE